MFYDQVKFKIQAGRGGSGAVAFRREKYIPFGGPSGGDGGRGGDVVVEVNRHLNTLFHFAHKAEFAAPNGENGRNKDMHGAGGDDLLLKVPPGTLIYDDETNQVLADLTEENQRVVIAKGGQGGRGNIRFATSTNKAPRIAENGDPGESFSVRLELKLLADVGLVGKPNAGKSTLLSVTTAATPKIAPYPFTTLQPNLGVVALGVNETFVIADVPGLIEGASEGKGLGHDFLRHIERCRVLIHLVDASALDPIEDFLAINEELESFGHGLKVKPQVVVFNKIDVPGVMDVLPLLKDELKDLGFEEVHAISALSRENLKPLLWRVYELVQTAPEPQLERPQPVIVRPETFEDELFEVELESPGIWRVTGGKIVRAVNRARVEYDEALLRLHGYLKRQGVLDALRDAGVKEEDTVRIGNFEFEWREEKYD